MFLKSKSDVLFTGRGDMNDDLAEKVFCIYTFVILNTFAISKVMAQFKFLKKSPLYSLLLYVVNFLPRFNAHSFKLVKTDNLCGA